MGKKRVIAKTEEELIKETEQVEKALKKEIREKPLSKVRRGKIYIKSSYNNTILSLVDERGDVLVQRSAGSIGFKGTKKGTAYAALQTTKAVIEVLKKLNLKDIEVYVKGIGSGRDAALRALAAEGLNLLLIKDITPIPHNGCRSKKPRRV